MSQLRLMLRKVLLPVFRRVNPGDIRIRNHHTGERLTLHSFRHKGYWFHGRHREAATMDLFRRLVKQGDTVVEVGGHIGYITQLFSRLVGEPGTVVVFEPGPNNLPYLRANVGQKSNVTIEPLGVGATNGSADFYVESLTGQNNSFVADFDGLASNAEAAGLRPDVERILVDVVTLDSYVADKGLSVDFIKVDVEGFEAAVIQGAMETLKTSRPALMVEIQAGYRELEAIASLLGYEVVDDELQPIDWGEPPRGNTFWFHHDVHAAVVARLRN